MKSIRWKVLTSLLLTLSFFSASLSGVLLYFTPRGRIANWTEWTILGLTKAEWTNLHLTAVALVLITALLHLFWFNWKVFLSYLGRAASGTLVRYPRELILAVLLFTLVTIGTMVELPGVFSLVDGRNAVMDSFELAANQPPVPHAEEMSIRKVSADLLDIPVDDVLTRLNRLGWPATGDDKLADVAKRYNVTPQRIFEELNAKPILPGIGMGWGQMTLRQVAEMNGFELEPMLVRARELGATSLSGNEIVKDIAESIGMKPYELLPKLDSRLIHP